MTLAQLRTPARSAPAGPSMRGTDGQDSAITSHAPHWRRHFKWYALAGAVVLVMGFSVRLIEAWSDAKYTVPLERLRIVPVTRGRFVRDAAADGTVVAPVSPTLFAAAAGTVSYAVHAGDSVRKGQVLATLDSPELSNEYERGRATLEGLNAALARQEIETRRQLLTNQQQADLAQVAIQSAERELKRNQAAWDLRVIPERDYQRAVDEVANARLNFAHARDTAALERDSVVLDLKTRRFERDAQALSVAALKRRVDELTVRSPVDGMVANLAQSDKAHVAESAPIVTVVDLSALEIEFRIPETYAGDIKPGMRAAITLAGRTNTGTVTAISPEVRSNEVTGRVRFAGAPPPGLRQNERASVRIVLDERDGVLQFERGSNIDESTRKVYVVRGSKAVRVPVELGAASVAAIEVVRGLSPGDRVIASDLRDFNEAPEITISN
jgi:HlyD family secretion protein